jgi:molybdate transport system substrate-binding protein
MAALQLLSSMAPKRFLAEALELYARSHAERVIAQFAGGMDVARRIGMGESVDVVVLSDDAIEKLQIDGYVERDSRMPLMSSGIAVAVPAGAVAPDISNEDTVKSAVLHAPSLSYSTGPSGRYLESLFARWGILESVRARIAVPPPGTPVAQLVADGSVAMGFQQLSEMLHIPGIWVVGSLPRDIQQETVFSGAITCISSQGEKARHLLRFLGSAELDCIKTKFGMSSLD